MHTQALEVEANPNGKPQIENISWMEDMYHMSLSFTACIIHIYISKQVDFGGGGKYYHPRNISMLAVADGCMGYDPQATNICPYLGTYHMNTMYNRQTSRRFFPLNPPV